MNAKLIDLTGQRFGKLLVLEISDTKVGTDERGKGGQRLWKCKCACGRISFIRSGELRRNQRSCGCSQFERTHGQASRKGRTKVYQIWNSMIQRCTNPNCKAWPRYGGRGITVCNAWKDFTIFFEDMGHPYGLTIERLDNDGPYAPWNCIWATWGQQNANKKHQVYPSRKQAGVPTGIYRSSNGKYRAAVTHHKDHYYLGTFDSAFEASKAYQKKLNECLNKQI